MQSVKASGMQPWRVQLLIEEVQERRSLVHYRICNGHISAR